MKYLLIFSIPILVALNSCIKDDIVFDTVEESLRILNPIDTLAQDDSYQFEVRFLNNTGQEETRTVVWASSAPNILSIDQNGLMTGLSMGNSVITAEVMLDGKPPVRDEIQIEVAEETIVSPPTERSGALQTTSTYQLEGAFVLSETDDGLRLELADDYAASSSLPGLYVYLTNNPNSVSGAFEIGPAESFSGAHTYDISEDIGINDFDYLLYYCKPFSVKVGDGTLSN